MVMMSMSMMVVVANTNVSQAKPEALPSVVKIGFLYPKTGGLGQIGQGVLDGAIAAAYRLNTTYGSTFKVQLVPEDTATTPATAATVSQTLISDGVQVIVGAAASGDTIAASAVTIPNRVPLISYASTNPAISLLNDSDYVMRVVASDLYQGQALAKLVVSEGVHSPYVLYQNTPYGTGVDQQFVKEFQALGYNISGSASYDPAASSFASEISTLKSTSGVDGVVLVAYPTDGNEVLQAADTAGVAGPWFGTDGIADPSVTNNSATVNYVSGNLFGTTPSAAYNQSGTLYTQFVNDETATNGSYGIYGDYAYDAVLLAGAAINKAGTYDGTAIRDALYQVANGFEGATSSNKAFDCAGDPISQSYDFWNATNGAILTMQAHAVQFTGLGNATTKACGLTPYTGTFSVNTSSAPGFEGMVALVVLSLISVKVIFKRKRN